MVKFLARALLKGIRGKRLVLLLKSLYKEIKMKKLTSVIITTSLLFSGLAAASVSTYEKGNSSVSTEICMAIAEGKASTLKDIMKSYNLTSSKLNEKLHCNGMPVDQFSDAIGKSNKKIARILKNS